MDNIKNIEYTLVEYPPQKYEKDMLTAIREDGLKSVIKKYLDMIVEETSGMPYIPNMSVKEWANDILNALDLWEKERANGRRI